MSAGNIGQQIINGTYGLDNRPPTAYEELKAWCEKHLKAGEYMTEKDNGGGYPHIDLYFFNYVEIVIWFRWNGDYDYTEVLD